MDGVGISHPSRRGVAMMFVLGALVVLGVFVVFAMRLVRIEDDLSFRDHLETQRTALLESAVAFGRRRWASDSLLGSETWSDIVWLEPGRVGFRVSAKPWGALVRMDVRLFVDGDSQSTRRIMVGGSARKDSMPTLGILESGQNLEVLPSASLDGEYWGNGAFAVASPGGKVHARHRVDRWVLNASLASRTGVAEAWWKSADRVWEQGMALDSGKIFSRRTDDTCEITGSWKNAEIRCDGVLRIRDAELDEVTAIANGLVMAGRNRADRVLIASRGNATMRGILWLSGQILAKDSMAILADTVHADRGLFHLLGRVRTNPGNPSDSISSSLVRIRTSHGSGTVVYAGVHEGSTLRQVHFVSDSTVDWNGVWMSEGGSEPKGRMRGSLLVRLLVRHDSKRVPWEGRLDGLALSGWDDSTVQVLPWTGRGEPAVWSLQ